MNDADPMTTPIWARSEDGARIAAYDFGGAGPAILLAHATGFHAHVWLPVVAHLRRTFHCYAFDARGHGASPSPPTRDFDWRRFGDDARAAADVLDLDQPRAAGHSAGGALLLAAEQDHPGSWSALWAYEPVIFPTSEGENPLSASARRRRPRFPSRQAAVERFAGKPPFDTFTPEALHAYVDHGFVDDEGGGVTLACSPDDEAATYDRAFHNGVWDRLDTVAVPVRAVAGGRSDHPPAAIIEQVAARLPHATVEIMSGLGHFGPMEDPERVAESIRRSP